MTNTDNSNIGDGGPNKDKIKEAAGAASQEVQARARETADTVVSEAGRYADQAKVAAADEVKSVSSALRTAADELRSGSPQERTFSQIADGLADASDAMRDKDLGEMVGAVTDFARRNPMVFLGSAALIGFAATRFAKASSSGAAGSAAHGGHGGRTDRTASSGRPGYSPAGNLQSPSIAGTTKGSEL